LAAPSARTPTEASDQGCSRRRSTGAGYCERSHAGAKRARRARQGDTASGTPEDSPTSQAVDDTLTRIAPEQQRQHQQSSRREREGHARARKNAYRDREQQEHKQPKRKAQACTMNRHAREHTARPSRPPASDDGADVPRS
jgi:hypothetical protein